MMQVKKTTRKSETCITEFHGFLLSCLSCVLSTLNIIIQSVKRPLSIFTNKSLIVRNFPGFFLHIPLYCTYQLMTFYLLSAESHSEQAESSTGLKTLLCTRPGFASFGEAHSSVHSNNVIDTVVSELLASHCVNREPAVTILKWTPFCCILLCLRCGS